MKILHTLLFVSIIFMSHNLHAQTTDSTNRPESEQIISDYLINYEANNALLKYNNAENFQLWSNVLIGIESSVFSKSTYNEIGDGIQLYNARISLGSKLFDSWRAKIELDFHNSTVSLKDIYLMYELNNINIKAGNYNEPFSMEKLTEPQFSSFTNYSLISEMAPGRHLGLSATYKGKWYMASGGVFFNRIDNIEAVSNTEQNKLSGIDEGISLTGRAVVNPILKNEMMLHIGVGGSYRKSKTDLGNKDTYRYATQSLSGINKKKYIDTDVIEDVDYTLLSNVELAAMYKNISLQAEYINNGIVRNNNRMMYVLDGFYVQAGYLIFGSSYIYNQAEGVFAKPDLANSWGELELTFRYDYSNANGKNARIYGGAGEGYSAALNWRANNFVAISLNYSYLRHDRYANGAGQYYIYEDDNGVKYADVSEMQINKNKAGEKFSVISLNLRIHL